MDEIKFSHNYPKLWGQKTARLLFVQELAAKAVHDNKSLIEYDTTYIKSINAHFDETTIDYDYYPIPIPKYGKLIQLVFLGDKQIPFCTIRSRYGRNGDKLEYYQGKIGLEFQIVIESGD